MILISKQSVKVMEYNFIKDTIRWQMSKSTDVSHLWQVTTWFSRSTCPLRCLYKTMTATVCHVPLSPRPHAPTQTDTERGAMNRPEIHPQTPLRRWLKIRTGRCCLCSSSADLVPTDRKWKLEKAMCIKQVRKSESRNRWYNIWRWWRQTSPRVRMNLEGRRWWWCRWWCWRR